MTVVTEYNLEEIRCLLDNTGSIIEKYRILSRETGSDFNIFDIAAISTDERVVCRVLYELLSPNGRHGLGGAYLDLFLRNCLNLEFNHEEITNASVNREFFAAGRFIDLTIAVGNSFIPIEVKVYARDQQCQCFDYYQFAKASDGKAQVVYLTLYGDSPRDDSAGGFTKQDEGYSEIKLMSFSQDIVRWLEKCLALPDTIRKAPIREIMIQFISVIKSFTNQREDKPMNEIKEILNKSEKNMQNAYAIADSLIACENEMRKKFFNAFCKRFDGISFPFIVSQNGTYDEHDNQWPGVAYIIKPEVEPGIKLRFYLQEDHYHNPIIAGFHYLDHDEPQWDNIEMMRSLAKKYFKDIKTTDSKQWTIFQKDIIFEKEGIYLLKTKMGDNNYFKLFDPNKFDIIIEKTVEQVKAMFDKLRLT